MGKEIIETAEKQEKAILISVIKKQSNRETAIEHLDELERLAETAGAFVVEKFIQELENPNPATSIGKGKVEEIKLEITQEEVQIVIFDDDLTPAQVRNLEKEWNVKVIDRSGLILDIFAQHAKSLEAKTQVELAQLQYLLPRLTRLWTHLSKQYGGIGTKGPGETQIEADRRMIRIRIQRLKEKLKDIDVQREQQRKGRQGIPRFALVGYTNAGKSTLMNSFTEADVYVENKLFATLDTTVRVMEMPNEQKVLLSDTVGFIRKLPSHLVASFRSTLAEAAEADILLHIVDVSHKYFREHINTVTETLEFLKIDKKPTILIFNKIDNLDDIDEIKQIEMEYPQSIFISAKRGINLNKLVEFFQEYINKQHHFLKLFIPYSSMELLPKLYADADILDKTDTDEGTEFDVQVKHEKYSKFLKNFEGLVVPHQPNHKNQTVRQDEKS